MQTLHAADADGWSRICSDTFVAIETSIRQSFTGRIGHVELSSAGFSRVDCDPCSVARTQRSIRSDHRNDFLVNIVQDGSGEVTAAGATHALPAGAVALCDAGQAYTLGFAASATVLTLRLPRAALPVFAQGTVIRPRIVGAGVGSGTILRHFVSGVLDAAESGEKVVDDIVPTAADLLMIALDDEGLRSADSGRIVDRDARYLLIRDYLDRHWVDPALTIEHVARRHGVSRRHVENLFARHDQSPAAYLRSVRLSRARSLLEQPGRRPITDIALRAGFNDVATLSRAFRRAYGMTPDAWRSDRAGRDELR
jgi:AraC family transcriptional regulator, positive regulator of tynA and feaB